MEVKYVDARREHARFLAWVVLTAWRSHLERGLWDFVVGGSEADCLRYLEALSVTGQAHWAHYSRFIIAEVEGRPAAALCMPALKEVVWPYYEPPVGPLPSAPHYKCYEIAGDPPGAIVDLETQFGFEQGVEVGPANLLCAPAIKTIEGAGTDPEGDLTAPHLKCYEIFVDDPEHIVNLGTQFGWEYDVEVGMPPPMSLGELCVPTEKTVLATPTPTPPPPTPTPAPGDCADPGSVPFPVPPGDLDCDGYSSADEVTIGTDPNDDCANTSVKNDEADDRWPSDFDDNQAINVLDLNQTLPPYFGLTSASPGWDPRHDLKVDNVINILDVNMTLPSFFGWVCT